MKTHIPNIFIVRALKICVLLLVFNAEASANDGVLDIYLAYTLKSKPEMKRLMSNLGNEKLNIKKSSLDLLAIADYSAKQKILVKFNSAKLTVIFCKNDANIFIDTERLNNVIVVDYYSPDLLEEIEKRLRALER